MAIKPLEDRIDIMTEGDGEPDPLPPPIEYPEAAPIEGEPQLVAGGGKELFKFGIESLVSTGKVIKKAIAKPYPTEAEKKAADAVAQQNNDVFAESQQIAIDAEKQATPGAVQKVKGMMRKAKKPKGQAAQPTQAEMQQAIKEAEVAGDVVTPSTKPVIAEYVYKRATPEKAKEFLSGNVAPGDDIDFNFNYLQTTEDIDKAINMTSKIFADEISVLKRGVVSDDALVDMAERLDILPDLLRAKIGTTFNAEQLVAARHLLVRSAQKLDDLATQAKNIGPGQEDDKLLLEFRNHLATHGAIQARLKAAQTETARALRSFRLPVDGSAGLADVNKIDALIGEMGGRKTLKEIAAAYTQLNDNQKAKFAELGATTGQNFKNIWKELYTTSLMSSTHSIERALFGNIVLTFARMADTGFAGTAGKAIDKVLLTPVFGSRSSDKVYASEALIEFANFITSVPKGLKAGLTAFYHDAPIYKGGGRDIDRMGDPAITKKLFKDPDSPTANAVDFLGKVVRLPHRAMLGVDEMTKAMIVQMETRRTAARDALLAMENGMDSDKAMDAMAAQIARPDARTLDKVHQAALENTLQTDMGGMGNALYKLRNHLDSFGPPVGTFLAPYIKTVVNSQKQILARTPVMQLALKEIRADYAAGGARRQMAIGKAAFGGAFMGLVYQQALDGVITGAGPVDPARRKILQETTGWQPFSIRIGKDEKTGKDIYRSYVGMEPIGAMLGMAATLAEVGSVYGAEGDDEWEDLLLYSTLLPFKYIGELPFMQGVSNFVGLIESTARNPTGEDAEMAANKFFGGMAQNFVGGVTPIPMPYSGLLRQIEKSVDPNVREVTPDPSLPPFERYGDFMSRKWFSGMPGLSTLKDKNGNDLMKPKRNLWGEIIRVGEPGIGHWITPFYKKEGELDQIEKTILDISKARQSTPINYPSKKIANIKLNDNEYSDMLLFMNTVTKTASYSGISMKAAMAKEMANPKYIQQMQNGAYEEITNKLSNIVSEYRDAAVASPMFKSLYPDLSMQIERNKNLAKQKYKQISREPVSNVE